MPAPLRQQVDPEQQAAFGLKRNTHIECAICQEEFTRTSLVCQMPCHIKHIFHSECIRPWILKQNACPLCKQAIPVSEERLPREDEDEYQRYNDELQRRPPILFGGMTL